MVDGHLHHSRAILYALAGFALWVLADTCMKLAGEAQLPSYEVVGFMGLFAALSLAVVEGSRGKLRALWPQRPGMQLGRALLTFGCVMANTVALKHLPLTLFYVAVFTAPMIIAVLAAIFLREHLDWTKIAAVIAGFAGVVIAVDPWDHLGGGDWIGYAAAAASALFFSIMTVWIRVMTRTESPQSITFFTGLVEGSLGLVLMFWHAVPLSLSLFAILVVMGAVNVVGNLCICIALKRMAAATVEQFHYTQIITGALLGFLIWHEVPAQHTIIGVAVIIASGLYVAATTHHAAKRAAAVTPATDN